MSEIDKRIDTLNSTNDLYDVITMLQKVSDVDLERSANGDFDYELTNKVLEKIGSDHPQGTAMAKILKVYLETR